MNKYIKTALLGLLVLNSFSAFPMNPALDVAESYDSPVTEVCRQEVCPICRENITTDLFIAPCDHTLHGQCLQDWKATHPQLPTACFICMKPFNAHALNRNITLMATALGGLAIAAASTMIVLNPENSFESRTISLPFLIGWIIPFLLA